MAREDYNIDAPIYPTWRVSWRICSPPEIWINTCFHNFQRNLYASKSVGKISNYSILLFNRYAKFAASPLFEFDSYEFKVLEIKHFFYF